MEYRLKFERYYYPSRMLFSLVRWQTGHECDCEFCERETGPAWVLADDENDFPMDLDDAIDELYGCLEKSPPEEEWLPVSERVRAAKPKDSENANQP